MTGRLSGHQPASRDSYTARVELASFRAFERKNVVLSSSVSVSRSAPSRSKSASLGETVTVEARGSHVNTAETQHAGVSRPTQIEQIQVLGRDVTSLMRLLPGVRYDRTGRLDRHELRHGRAERRRRRAATGATSSSTASSRNEIGATA